MEAFEGSHCVFNDYFHRSIHRWFAILVILHIFTVDATNLKLEHREDDSDEISITGAFAEEEIDLVDSIVLKATEIPEEKVTYDRAQVWRLHADKEKAEYVSYLEEAGDVSMWVANDSMADVLVRSQLIETVRKYLTDKQINYDVVIHDLQKAIQEENPIPSQEILDELEGRKARYAWWRKVFVAGVRRKHQYHLHFPVASNVYNGEGDDWQLRGHRMEWSSYHRYDDMLGFLEYLAQTFPNVCSVMTIGHSIEGRPLKVIRIGNGKSGVPAIWIDGGIHAREWISPAVVTYVINYLVENSENLEADYYILPVVNPDGYEYTFRGDRLWRKNRSGAEKGGVCTGVDLNRNFGYEWGGLGTSKQPCREIYAGTRAFSEPETNAINKFFQASSANFKAYLTFHSYGQYILYPWGYNRRVPPDYEDLDKIGRQAAAAMKRSGMGSIYTVGNSATTLYPASGGSDDWAKGSLKIKYAYTIELGDTGKHGFVLPARYIIPTAKEALAALEVIAEACKTA